MHASTGQVWVGVAEAAAERVAGRWPELTGSGGRQRFRLTQGLLFQLEVLQAALAVGRPELFAGVGDSRCHDPARHSAQPAIWRDALFAAADEVEARSLPEAATASRLLRDAAGRQDAPSRELDARYLPSLPQTRAVVRRLLAGDLARIQHLVEAAMAGGAGYLDVAVRILQPAMWIVGDLWAAGRITVAQEHLATATVQSLLSRLYAGVELERLNGHRALVACVTGNRHALGARIIGDAFELEGWEVQYLGADVPEDALLAQLHAWRPDVAGLSVSMPSQVPAAVALIGRLRAELGSQRPLVLAGGFGTGWIERPWRSWAPTPGRPMPRAPSPPWPRG